MKCKISTLNTKKNNNILSIQLQGTIQELSSEEKIRVVAVFETPNMNRRILCETTCFWNTTTQELFFFSNAQVELPYVFLHPVVNEFVSLHFEIENAKETLIEQTFTQLPSYHFEKPKERKSPAFSIYGIISFFICILLLPLFLLDGYFALKGYKKLDTGENAIKTGKKAILFHVNALTKRISGYSYSLREWKTAYLNHCYQKQVKKPVHSKKILLLSERKLEKNSNMDCIYQELLKNPSLEIETYINPCTIDKLKFREIQKIAKKMSTSSLIILEDFYPQIHFVSIRPETKIIQLWHACGAFKTFGFSRLGKVGGPKQSSPNHRSYDYAFVSGKMLKPVYAEAFGISQENVAALGVPRTDIFFHNNYKEEKRQILYEKYPQLKDKSIILFAPTFRGNGNKDAYYPTDRFSIDYYMEHLPNNIVLILKNHPFVKDTFTYEEKWKNRVLDLSNSENINDLLLITNLLITDYSSSIFEASLLQIPMIFYVFDKEEYLRERDVYYDFDTFVPGDIVETQENLLDSIKENLLESSMAQKTVADFRNRYLDALDGNCTKRITTFIETLLS